MEEKEKKYEQVRKRWKALVAKVRRMNKVTNKTGNLNSSPAYWPQHKDQPEYQEAQPHHQLHLQRYWTDLTSTISSLGSSPGRCHAEWHLHSLLLSNEMDNPEVLKSKLLYQRNIIYPWIVLHELAMKGLWMYSDCRWSHYPERRICFLVWFCSALNHTSWFSVPLSGFWLQDTDWGHQTSNCSRLRLLETFCKWDWKHGGLCLVTAAGDTFSHLEASQYRLMWRRREGWWRMYWRDGQSSNQNV